MKKINKTREINKRGKGGRERQSWAKENEEEILQPSSIQPRTTNHDLA